MQKLLCLAAAATTLVISACAHTIVITPDVVHAQPAAGGPTINKNVGYYISTENRELKMTTGGGGGDKVSYQPYRDIESPLYSMLDNVFSNVTQLNAPNDATAVAKNNIAYIITPEISTASSSDSALTWPPTDFTISLTLRVADAAGKLIVTRKVVGEGRAEFSEFRTNPPLSGKRAVEDAMSKMQVELLQASEIR